MSCSSGVAKLNYRGELTCLSNTFVWWVNVKVKVQIYGLISSLKTYYPTLHITPWSLDLFIRVPFQLPVADPECARGGGISHILAEKRGVSFTLLKKMHKNLIFSPITGGGGGAYAGYALCWIRHWLHWEHIVLQLFRRIELIVHIAIFGLPGTHFHLSQVKHLRVKALSKDTTFYQCPKIEREEHNNSLKILHQAGFETARQAATSAERHALTIAPCRSLCQNNHEYVRIWV